MTDVESRAARNSLPPEWECVRRMLSSREIASWLGLLRKSVRIHASKLLRHGLLCVSSRRRIKGEGVREGFVCLKGSPRPSGDHRAVDALMPTRTRTYAEFLVEACALWVLLHEGALLSRAGLVAELAAEVQEEGDELARAAVDALFRDRVLGLHGAHVRCVFSISDLTEPYE